MSLNLTVRTGSLNEDKVFVFIVSINDLLHVLVVSFLTSPPCFRKPVKVDSRVVEQKTQELAQK